MANKLNRHMSTEKIYEVVQEYLLDKKEPWRCFSNKSGNRGRILFLNITGGQIRFYLDYKSNPYKWAHSDLNIQFFKDENYQESSFAIQYDGSIYYKELFIDNDSVKEMRELAESIYKRVYAVLYAEVMETLEKGC